LCIVLCRFKPTVSTAAKFCFATSIVQRGQSNVGFPNGVSSSGAFQLSKRWSASFSAQTHTSRLPPDPRCSNVVDIFMRVREIPKAGDKGYFSDPLKTVEGRVVGGVTLNHLAW